MKPAGFHFSQTTAPPGGGPQFQPSRYSLRVQNIALDTPSGSVARLWITRSRRGMKAAEGYIGGPEVKSTSFLPARRRSGGRTRGRGGILWEPCHRIAVVLE